MQQTTPTSILVELSAMRLLAHSGTFPGAMLLHAGPGWIIYLGDPKRTVYVLRSQRDDNQPRYFRTADSAFKIVKSIGLDKAIVMLDPYATDQASLA